VTADLSRLAELASAATPGPWHADATSVHLDDGGALFEDRYSQVTDRAYIAAASPDVILDLLARLQQAEERLARVEAVRRRWVVTTSAYTDHGSNLRMAWQTAHREIAAALDDPEEA
jgi:hypothetical protein